MCGIVGLYLKDSTLGDQLGAVFEPMLLAMAERGPDSAGFAVYGRQAAPGALRFSLQCDAQALDWTRLGEALATGLDPQGTLEADGSAAVIETHCGERAFRDWLAQEAPQATIMSVGSSIRIVKGVGHPARVAERFRLRTLTGTHMIGHTRMATESAVSLAGSHPFSTGHDLCLVHNGSLSNHNRVRAQLLRRGLRFETENDSEVAAAYLTWRLLEGDTLVEALNHALADLDGFYTFAVGTATGFAVLRDPIACKPAVLAETDRYVAMASEYRALARLPGIDQARVWEPEPGIVYAWEQPQRTAGSADGTALAS